MKTAIGSTLNFIGIKETKEIPAQEMSSAACRQMQADRHSAGTHNASLMIKYYA
jgi:hypothetical protein